MDSHDYQIKSTTRLETLRSVERQNQSNALARAELKRANAEREAPKPHSLLPDRHRNKNFFSADLLEFTLKDDRASMEIPLFTLSTRPDLSVWTWASKDGNKHIEVFPSVKGRATQFDKDVLIYIISQLTQGLNLGRDDAKCRCIRFVVYDYLLTTNKLTGGVEYKRMEHALDRLRGTTIKTDITTGGRRVKEAFGIIDRWKIVERSAADDRMAAVEVTLSEWLFNAVQAHEVLTLHRDYFRLRKPLERKLYEVARKHCGHQAKWEIRLENLSAKCGSKSELKGFRRQIIIICQAQTLPEYKLTYMDKMDKVIFSKRVGN